ncbi:uncharacterized protein LOC118149219 isoform X2 [Callithrix jacchus]
MTGHVHTEAEKAHLDTDRQKRNEGMCRKMQRNIAIPAMTSFRASGKVVCLYSIVEVSCCQQQKYMLKTIKHVQTWDLSLIKLEEENHRDNLAHYLKV